jgi:hypothetical protein
MRLPREVGRRTRTAALLWALALVISFFGLSKLVPVGLIGDDFVVYMQGLAQLWSKDSFGSYIASNLSDLTTGNHVLPVAALFWAIYVRGAELLSHTPLSVSESWGVFRVASIVIAEIAAAFFMASWGRLSRLSFGFLRRSTLSYFLIISCVTLATIQIHAVWSNDPVISYSLASWGTAVFAFLYGGAIARILTTRQSKLWLWGLALPVFGILGVLSYEMMLGAIAAGGISIVVYIVLNFRNRPSWIRLAWLATGVAIPFVTLAFTQWLRWQQPQTYAGTTGGYAALVIPVFKTGVLGSVPLSSGSLAIQYGEGFPPRLLDVLLPLIAILLLLGFLYLINRPIMTARTKTVSFSLPALLSQVAFLLALWCVSTLIFAASSKYQVEIGQTIGHVYLFYSVGLLSVSCLLVIGFLIIGGRTKVSFVLVALVVLIPLAIIQGGFNSRSLQVLDRDMTWTKVLADQLGEPGTESERCTAFGEIAVRELPDWYSSGLIAGIESAYQNRYGQEFCPNG